MSCLICFIDKEGFCGTCEKEAMGETDIDCDKCSFKKKFEGDEEKEFIYCFWKGEIQTNFLE